MKRIAACYIRVSTDDQTELSPSSQLEALREYADNHDYIIPEEYIFKDEGISGRTTKKRPEFNRMIGVAKTKPKPFEAVLLWKFSRFARNRTDAIVYKNLLRNELGIDVISISESLGEDRGTALILESMFEAMDEYYSINLSTEVKRSMKLKAEKGQPLSIAPFGYQMIDKQFVIDPQKAEIIKYIFDAYINGDGIRKIATFLGESGVKTNRGSIPDHRFVSYILENPVYCGYTRWCSAGHANYGRKGEIDMTDVILSKGTHEPIISEELFEKVQNKIKETRQRFQKYQRTEAPKDWLFKGLIKCDSCGSTLVRCSSKVPSLQCHSYSRGVCQISHYLTISNANRVILSGLENAVKTLNFNVISASNSNKREKEKIEMLKRAVETEKAKLLKAREAYEAGVDSIEEFRERKKALSKNVAELETELKKAQREIKPKFNKADFGKKVASVLSIVNDENANIDVKNNAIRTIVHHIEFCKPQNEFKIFFYV